jgi:hypothetical protein
MWAEAWRLVSRAVLILGLLLTFAVVVEVLDLFLALHRVSPTLAWSFGVLGGGCVVGGLIYLAWAIRARPRVLTPPRPVVFEAADERTLAEHLRYLGRYARNLSRNPLLSVADRSRARDFSGRAPRLPRTASKEEIEARIKAAEADLLLPLLTRLRGAAEEEVQRCVRDVMMGVTISPIANAGGELRARAARGSAIVLSKTRDLSSHAGDLAATRGRAAAGRVGGWGSRAWRQTLARARSTAQVHRSSGRKQEDEAAGGRGRSWRRWSRRERSKPPAPPDSSSR